MAPHRRPDGLRCGRWHGSGPLPSRLPLVWGRLRLGPPVLFPGPLGSPSTLDGSPSKHARASSTSRPGGLLRVGLDPVLGPVQRRHHREAVAADLADRRAQRVDQGSSRPAALSLALTLPRVSSARRYSPSSGPPLHERLERIVVHQAVLDVLDHGSSRRMRTSNIAISRASLEYLRTGRGADGRGRRGPGRRRACPSTCAGTSRPDAIHGRGGARSVRPAGGSTHQAATVMRRPSTARRILSPWWLIARRRRDRSAPWPQRAVGSSVGRGRA